MTRRRRTGEEAARARSASKAPASIHDVAERAGVSIKTVSRVLNREPNVSAATRERVQQAAAALSYRPNPFARTLASGRRKPTPDSADGLGVVADIGGTNCRFALVDHEARGLIAPESYSREDFADFVSAMRAYLDQRPERAQVRWAVVAAAGPVSEDGVGLTNGGWRIETGEIAAVFKLANVSLVNDFAAMAAAVGRMEAEHLQPLGGGAPQADSGIITRAVIGPGTGLGVGGLVGGPFGETVLATEGGHVLFAPVDALEREVNRLLEARFGRVSYERLLCGEGLVSLYQALCEIEGEAPGSLEPGEIVGASRAGQARAAQTLAFFTRSLGSFAGDAALMLGARGGVYLTGGVMGRILDQFDTAAFRQRFEAKGRFRSYMEAIPVWAVTHPFPGLLGAAALAPGGT